MKLGLWGLRADSRGLAHQTQSFMKWLEPTRVMGLDLTEDDLSPYPVNWPDNSRLAITRFSNVNETMARDWLRGLDVVIGAETFYRYEFPEWARDEGVRTVLQINPEFAPYWAARPGDVPRPDVLIAPTTWMIEKMPGVIHLPFPVDREEFPFRLRTHADHFVHVAGHRAVRDRAGSRLVLASLRRLQPGLRITLRSQSDLGFELKSLRYPNARIEVDNVPHPGSLYVDADVVVIPRRYGGNSLVHQEALSSGCPVITLNRPPENEWGGVTTIPTRVKRRFATQFGDIEWWDGNSAMLAQKMVDLNKSPDEVERLSRAADVYAESISWDSLLGRYNDLFAEITARV